jgi:hypothetical protein
MSRFTNKIVLITGGTSGIGLAAARQFIKEGAKVIVTGRSPQSVGDAQKELGPNGIAIAADVTKSAELDSSYITGVELRSGRALWPKDYSLTELAGSCWRGPYRQGRSARVFSSLTSGGAVQSSDFRFHRR